MKLIKKILLIAVVLSLSISSASAYSKSTIIYGSELSENGTCAKIEPNSVIELLDKIDRKYLKEADGYKIITSNPTLTVVKFRKDILFFTKSMEDCVDMQKEMNKRYRDNGREILFPQVEK